MICSHHILDIGTRGFRDGAVIPFFMYVLESQVIVVVALFNAIHGKPSVGIYSER